MKQLYDKVSPESSVSDVAVIHDHPKWYDLSPQLDCEWEKFPRREDDSPNSTVSYASGKQWDGLSVKDSVGSGEDWKRTQFLQSTQSILGNGHEPTPTRISVWTKRHLKRGIGVLCCALAATVVFLLNLILTVIILSTQQAGKDGQYILFDGVCLKTRRYSVIVHVFINLLGTILLGTSNYCMQVLAAPTRKDIDRAHGKKEWLEVGVQSLRNLRYISLRRRVLWILLGLSSLPLHLL
jgi:hypothetical protein